MNVIQENIGVIVVFYSAFILLILISEIKSNYKIILIGALWILMGLTIGILYPDEFSDFILGDIL